MVGRSGNRSPELSLRTARSGRGCIRRHGLHGDREICQGHAQSREEGTSADKEAREGWGSPESSKIADSSGGAAWSHSSSLAALRSTLARGNREGA
jgi:hypothetical protein